MFDYDSRFTVFCETQEEIDSVLSIFEDNGVLWSEGQAATKYDVPYWPAYISYNKSFVKKRLTVNNSVYGRLDYLSYNDFLHMFETSEYEQCEIDTDFEQMILKER